MPTATAYAADILETPKPVRIFLPLANAERSMVYRTLSSESCRRANKARYVRHRGGE
jgi:hypothetical protein